ncbi:MAG: DUF4910 domain-containing protein [Ruminococcaceae bacterium]|nr:DUF4910 domain-containing protein [Oscillospiraceae bacterium]
MTPNLIQKIFTDTAYIRTGGSPEELKAAEYIRDICRGFGAEAVLEEFDVQMATMQTDTLTVDGVAVPCKGYLNAGSHEVEAPLYYLTGKDKYALEGCRGKIVLFDGYLGYWRYRDLLEHGAVGFITYDGSVNYADNNIDRRELRAMVCEGVEKIPGVNINAKDAVALIKSGAKNAKITLSQDEYVGKSRNVVLDLPGEVEETIIFTAHYDSTSLSQGAYDNMSGSVGLLAMAEYFTAHPHKRTLRFVWCGSEERGLLGSKAYCAEHEEELGKIALCINLDMIGCTMGHLIACCTTEEALVSYISYLGRELGTLIDPYQDVYSSDSTPMADKGIPAVSFARVSPREAATIHNSYDTAEIIKVENMQVDIDLITVFAERMANAIFCPVRREIPDNIKEKIDEYLCRKRKK